MNAVANVLQNLSFEGDSMMYLVVGGLGFVMEMIISIMIADIPKLRVRADSGSDEKAHYSAVARALWLCLKSSLSFAVALESSCLIIGIIYDLVEKKPDSHLPTYYGILAAATAVFVLGFAASVKYSCAASPDSDKPEDEISATCPVLLEEPQMETIALRVPDGIFDNGLEVPFEWLQTPETTEDETTTNIERTTEEKEWAMAISDGEWEKFPPHMVPGIDYPPPSTPNFSSIQIIS